jgi:hypothetical protein
MRKPLLLTIALAAAGMATSACSSDGAVTPEPHDPGTLSAAEVVQLNQALLAVSVSARQSGTPPVGESSGAMRYGFTQTAACPSGGNVGLDGDMDIRWSTTAGTSSISTDFAVKHNDCGHRLENGDVIRITGTPDIDVSMDVATSRTGLTSLVVRQAGAFAWSRNEGGSGQCTLDVTATLNTSSRVVAISGSFCGIPVSGRFQDV